jgi:hypothetical protein
MALDISQIQLPPAGVKLRLPPAARRKPGYPEICWIIEAHTSSPSGLNRWKVFHETSGKLCREEGHRLNLSAASRVK